MNKELKLVAPNAKQIFIVYNEYIPEHHTLSKIKFVVDKMNDKLWDELEKETDIQIVRTKDIMGFYFNKNYKLEADFSDWHPNARAWAEFTPKFVEKYIE